MLQSQILSLNTPAADDICTASAESHRVPRAQYRPRVFGPTSESPVHTYHSVNRCALQDCKHTPDPLPPRTARMLFGAWLSSIAKRQTVGAAVSSSCQYVVYWADNYADGLTEASAALPAIPARRTLAVPVDTATTRKKEREIRVSCAASARSTTTEGVTCNEVTGVTIRE